MGWRDLLKRTETVVLPWVGGWSLQSYERAWVLDELPLEHGWYKFELDGRRARLLSREQPAVGAITNVKVGYLVGDRLVSDDVPILRDPKAIVNYSEKVHFVDDGLDRFVRISAGRTYWDGPFMYKSPEFPLGPEREVLNAYLDQEESIAHIKSVSPALDAAFRVETWRRAEADRRRAELARLAREREEQQRKEEQRQEIVKQLGDAAGRRAMAHLDFGEAARSALTVGGAQYLDHKKAYRAGEVLVRFRLDRRRFECTCDEHTLRIIDAGICLTSHETGERGDDLFTLESLPAVIKQAELEGKLVILRHLD